MRKSYYWKLKRRELSFGPRTLIMGVLNVTPDSFSDGGKFSDPDRAFAHALAMEEAGADMIDIGAESTRPGSSRISAAEELRRLIPVLKRLQGNLRVPVSVDTYKAEVAEHAIELGAEIINDPTGFTFDPLLAKVLIEHDAGVILNHMRGTPETWAKLPPMPDVMNSIVKDLDASIGRARRSGVDRNRVVIDPGIGFGKRKEQNSEILARLGDMARLELPIMVGPSRKSFLAQSTDRETAFATAAAITAAVLGGAHMVRVHDVLETRAVLAIADEVARAIRSAADAAASDEPVKKPKSHFAGATKIFAPGPEIAETPRKRMVAPIAAKKPAALPAASEFTSDQADGQSEAPVPAAEPPQAEERSPAPRKFAARSTDRERSGPPKRFGTGDRERSGPPKRFGDRDRSGPPKRFGSGDRDSGPPKRFGTGDRDKSGPPKRFGTGDRSGPPKRFGSGDRDSGPPKRFGDRDRSGPPKRFGTGDRDKSGPPKKFGSGDRSGPPKRFGSGDRDSGPPKRFGTGGPRKFGSGGKPSGPPRKFGSGGGKPGGPPRGSRPPRPSRDK